MVAKKAADKFKKFSKEQMNKFMKWLLDSSMKSLDETFSSENKAESYVVDNLGETSCYEIEEVI